VDATIHFGENFALVKFNSAEKWSGGKKKTKFMNFLEKENRRKNYVLLFSIYKQQQPILCAERKAIKINFRRKLEDGKLILGN
jgi:hypothetical protein